MEKRIEAWWNNDPSCLVDVQAERECIKNLNDFKFDTIRKFTTSEFDSKTFKDIDEYWNKYLFTEDEKDGIITHYVLVKDEAWYSILIEYELKDGDPRISEYKNDNRFKLLDVYETAKYLKFFEIK
jgi:hypothetical protein